MNQYELAAKVAKYATIVTSIYILSHFGLNIHFDNTKKASITNNYSE